MKITTLALGQVASTPVPFDPRMEDGGVDALDLPLHVEENTYPKVNSEDQSKPMLVEKQAFSHHVCGTI